MSPQLALLLIFVSGTAACTAYDANAPGALDDSATDDTASTGPDGDSADSAAEDLAAEWFTIGGTWHVAGGTLLSVSLRLAAYPQDPQDGELCASERESALLRDLSSPDETIYHWWLIETGADDSACPQLDPLPRRIIVGLGAMHPEMAPALDRYDLESAGGSLYGSYAALVEGGDVDGAVPYAYGFAGTSSDRDGDGTAVNVAPIPDGDYVVTPVYVFALPDA